MQDVFGDAIESAAPQEENALAALAEGDVETAVMALLPYLSQNR